MAMHIIADGAQLDAILDGFERAAAHWAGGAAQSWSIERETHGKSFARGEDFYVFIERAADSVALGVARQGSDADALRIAFDRELPAARQHDVALMWDEDDADAFVLLSEAHLQRLGVYEPFRRLAGAPHVKRAEIDDGQFLMIGPLDKPRAAEALAALARLAPVRQATETLYPVSAYVRAAHRARERALAHLAERLSAAGYHAHLAEAAGMTADLAMTKAGGAMVFIALRDAASTDIAEALGRFALCAPREADTARVLVLPAPNGDDGGALECFLGAFQELGVSVMFYDISDDGARTWFAVTDEALSAHVRSLVESSEPA